MSGEPCGADATVFSFVAHFLSPLFTTPILSAADQQKNLVRYRDRVLERYFKA
jgi:hypothetical protein